MSDTDTDGTKRCHKCSGDVESEIEGNFEDWRCQDCGIIVGGGRLVESDTE